MTSHADLDLTPEDVFSLRDAVIGEDTLADEDEDFPETLIEHGTADRLRLEACELARKTGARG